MSDEPVRIDGSKGEGGGQMLRTALAMSAVTGKTLVVENIRANRPKPGLARQHMAGLGLIAEMSGAEVLGCSLGSRRVEFSPQKVRHGDYSLDVGTAGSVTLVLQTVLPALASVPGESCIRLSGGTDVRWSPPVDYYRMMLFPTLAGIGLECSLKVERRGYYPAGGGKVTVNINSKGRLEPLELDGFHEAQSITGIINITGLKPGIAERAREAGLGRLPDRLRGIADIDIQHKENGPSQGMGIAIAASDGKHTLGADSLGERGKPAEKVGTEAMGSLLAEMEAGAGVDLHASDQLLPYLAMAGGAFTARELTSHAEANIRTIEAFLGKCISAEKGEVVRFSKQ